MTINYRAVSLRSAFNTVAFHYVCTLKWLKKIILGSEIVYV